MTDREKAVEILSEISEKRYGHQFVSLQMAIEALKQPSVTEILDKISAEIKRMEYHMIDCDVLVSQEEVLEIIEKYKKEVSE